MKSFKKIALVMALLMGVGIVSQKGFSYSFNAWTTQTGEKTFIFNPLFSSIQSTPIANSYLNPAFLYGFSAKSDIIFVPTQLQITQWDAGTGDTAQKAKYVGSWAMPRYDLGDNNIVAVQLGYVHSPIDGVKDSFLISPQYHYVYEKENVPFAFEANIGFNYYTESSLNLNNIFLIAAPVYKVAAGKFHIFCEIDPYYNLQGDSTNKGLWMNIIPGVWIGLDGGKYQIVAGAQFTNVVKPSDSTLEVGKGFVAGFSYTF